MRRSHLQVEEGSKAVDLQLEFAFEAPLARRFGIDVAERGLQPAIRVLKIRPTHHPVAPENGQCVVAELPFGDGRVRLETIRPSPEQFEAAPVPHDRIEGGEQAYS